jgi:hypothetical protein
MTSFTRLLGAAAAAAAVAAPGAAQYYPQQTYPVPAPQTYPGYPGYPQQNYPYGYNQGYTGNPVTDIIDQLLGNRYNVTDRQAVRRCANAAAAQASSQYGNGYNYGGRYNNYGNMRVTAITDVERRSYGLRVTGLLGNGGYGNGYGYDNRGYGYGNGGYGAQLSFRCNVDYRGAVTDLRVRPAGRY